MSRIRAAWLVLMGQRLTPQQIQAEWAEYQQIFDDILSRWSASLARQAKARKKELERLETAAVSGGGEGSMPSEVAHKLHKADLRKRAASMGLSIATGGPGLMPSAVPAPPNPGEDD